jgi:hypothetical protein
MRRLVLLGVIALGACTKSTAPVTTPTAPAPAPAHEPRLLDHVPDDTPFLFTMTGTSFAGVRIHDYLDQMRAKAAPALAAVDDDMFEAMKPDERIAVVALRAMSTLTVEDMARLGFDPARMEFAAYGWGLHPVIRFRLDGTFLRERIDRALKDAGLDLRPQRWGEHDYWTYTGEGGFQIIGVILDDQLVVSVARDPASILPHMVGDAEGRPAHAFELATINKRYPDLRGEPIFFFDPDRLASLLGNVDRLRTLKPDATPACAKGIGDTIRTLPVIAWTMTEPDRKTRVSNIVVGPAPTLAKVFAAAARPIPRWPADPGHAESVFAFGFAPLPVLEAISDYIDQLGVNLVACGVPRDSTSMRDDIRGLVPVLGGMNGSTWVIHVIPETEDMPLQVEVMADVNDPYAIYSWLSSQLGLPSRPPTLGTPTPVSIGFLPATIVLESRAMAATLGRHDAAAFDKLRKAPAGPRVIMRIAMGPGSNDGNPDGTSIMEATVSGDSLLFEMIEKAP